VFANYANNGGACARTLPINSTKEVLPGGPVSSVGQRNEIFGGARTINLAKTSGGRSTIAFAKLFAGLATVARKILQQGKLLDSFCLAGADFLA
jgi:hypothetical protein